MISVSPSPSAVGQEDEDRCCESCILAVVHAQHGTEQRQDHQDSDVIDEDARSDTHDRRIVARRA